MPYIPKSQLNFKFTNQGLVEKATKDPYSGPYMETSDGKLFIGHDNFNPGAELIIKPNLLEKRVLDRTLDKNEKYFSFTKDVRAFNIRNNSLKKSLEFKTKLAPSKPTPNTEDYRVGFFRRYFARRINGNLYIEISKKAYNSIKDEMGPYDSNLYNVGSIIWYLRGSVHQQNALQIKKIQSSFPNILHLFPILNEYFIEDGEVQENLETQGGELFYENGDEYIGLFHIHPDKGPMVGAQHVNVAHEKLYFFQSLPTIEGQSYEAFVQSYNQIECFKCIQMTPTSDPQVISNKRSSLVGCPAGSFNTYNEALDSCPQIISTQPPSIEGFYSAFSTSSIAEFLLNNLQNNNEESSGGESGYSSGGSTGGGTSGGGASSGGGSVSSGGGGGGY
tara:strand:- start:97 stop:1266 length:1170 start_codon:yes stop_codon:yes gene_type:complete